jgi:hypothetical protein
VKREPRIQASPRAEEERKARCLRVLVAARRLFGEGAWMNRAAVALHCRGLQNVTYYLGCLEREGRIEHRTLRGESQWRAPLPATSAEQDSAKGEPSR